MSLPYANTDYGFGGLIIAGQLGTSSNHATVALVEHLYSCNRRVLQTTQVLTTSGSATMTFVCSASHFLSAGMTVFISVTSATLNGIPAVEVVGDKTVAIIDSATTFTIITTTQATSGVVVSGFTPTVITPDFLTYTHGDASGNLTVTRGTKATTEGPSGIARTMYDFDDDQLSATLLRLISPNGLVNAKLSYSDASKLQFVNQASSTRELLLYPTVAPSTGQLLSWAGSDVAWMTLNLSSYASVSQLNSKLDAPSNNTSAVDGMFLGYSSGAPLWQTPRYADMITVAAGAINLGSATLSDAETTNIAQLYNRYGIKIGTTTQSRYPAMTLHWAGDRNNLYMGYFDRHTNSGTSIIANLFVAGAVYAGGSQLSSDDRIKSRTQGIANATTTLMQLNPVRYEKHPSHFVEEGVEDSDLTDVEHFTEAGFEAQAVEQISELAWTVRTPANLAKEPRSLDYNSIIAYLVAGFKEQQAEIEALKAR